MRRARHGLVVALLLAAAAAGCARRPPEPPAPPPPGATSDATGEQPPPGIFYQVQPGQTLWTICRTYGVALADVVQANDLLDADRIEAGQILFIPGAARVLDVPATFGVAPPAGIAFLRPTVGPVNSGFGPRRGGMHYGLDLGAPAGSEVKAAREGVVVYAGDRYQGYGKLVIVDHGDGYQTLYAHGSRLLTRAGRRVKAGQVIALVGNSGNASGPHLHFELRRENRPLDPTPYLVETLPAAAR